MCIEDKRLEGALCREDWWIEGGGDTIGDAGEMKAEQRTRRMRLLAIPGFKTIKHVSI